MAVERLAVIADELSSGGRADMDDDGLLLLQRQIVGLQQRRGGASSDPERKRKPREEEQDRARGAADAYGGAAAGGGEEALPGGLAAVEGEAERRLRGKEAELEVARLRSAALEEKVRQLSAEGQMWVAATRHHEAAVGVLRASLERTLLRLQQSGGAAGREGYGDSEAASAESSRCFAAEEKGRCGRIRRRSGWCMACGLRAARALLLPCKHLCLCEDCEPAAGQCPVCGAVKTAGVQVFTC